MINHNADYFAANFLCSFLCAESIAQCAICRYVVSEVDDQLPDRQPLSIEKAIKYACTDISRSEKQKVICCYFIKLIFCVIEI